MGFSKILLTAAISFSIALSLFGVIYITQPTNAAISPTPTLTPTTRPTTHYPPLNLVTKKNATERRKTKRAAQPNNDSQYCQMSRPDPLPFPLSHFLTGPLSPFLAQDGVDFELPLSDSFALVSNFPGLKKQEEDNNPVFLVNFDQNALVGLRYAHQETIWDTEVKVVTGLASPDGNYRFILSLTKNF